MDSFRAGLARAAAVTILLTVATVAPTAAATRTWAGGSGGVWSVAGNWSPAIAPVAGDDLVFDATGSGSSVNDLPDIRINTIAASVVHTITGSNFLLTSGISSTSAGDLEILVTVTLFDNQTWTTSGTVRVTQVVLNGRAWTVDGADDVEVSAITDSGSIAKSGVGTLRLMGDNTFAGLLVIDAGKVEVRTAQGLGVSDGTQDNGTIVNVGGCLSIVSAAPLTLDDEAMTLWGTGISNGGALEVLSTDPVTFTGTITLAVTTHVSGGTPGHNRNVIFNGPVKGPGDLVIMGATIAVLGATGNTLTGVDFTGPGTLRVGFPNALSTARVNVPAGATLDINDSGTDVLGLDGAGTVTLGATAGTLTIKNTLPSTFTGTIGGANGILIKDGNGTLTLGGSNTFARGPRIDAGTLRATHPNALGAGDGTQNTGTQVLEGATLALDNVTIGNEHIHLGGTTQASMLQVMGTNPSAIDGPVVISQLAAITGTDGATLTFNGELTIGPTAVAITNAHVVVMNPASSVEGPVSVYAGGTLAAGAAGVFSTFTELVLSSGTFALNGHAISVRSLSGNGVVAFGTNGALQLWNTTDTSFAGTSTGTGTLTKNGAAAFTLSSAFAVSGNVTVNHGSLILAHAQALATTPKITTTAGGGLFYTVPATPAYQLDIIGGGPAGEGAVQVTGGDVTFTGPITTAGGFDSIVRVHAPHTATFMGQITAPVLSIVGSGTAVFGSTGHALTALYIGATPNTNAVIGPTTVRFAVANALSAPFDLEVNSGSTFDLNGFDLTVKSVTGAGTVAIGSRTLTIQNGALFEGSLTGTGAIVAAPGQSLLFSGTSTFTGTVTAEGISNSGALPAAVHANSTTLRLLPNSVTGPVTMGAGVFLIAGDDDTAAGVTTGNVNLPAGAFMSAYLHTTTMTVNGTVTLVGELNPFLHPSVSTPGQVITLIDNDGTDPVIGMFGNFGENAIVQIDEASYRISYSGGTGNDVTLTKQTATYFLSEGATGAFFDTDLLIANPHPEIADVSVEFYREDGELEGYLYHIPAKSRLTIRVDELPDMEAATFSTIVRSNNPALNLIVERTMRWDATGYGAHTEKATSGPALNWYFAEGSEGFFRTYLLLANPDFVANTATVTYLREGESAITRTYDLLPSSRFTVQAADDPELVGRSFGMTVVFARRGIAERAMYFGESPIWKGGHESLGETEPAATWFLAEGATGAGFDTFILVANPNAEPADVTYTFLSELASPVTLTRTIPGLSRLTINIEAEGLSIPDGPVATQVSATRPVIAERAQYWPFSVDQWTETHNSFGVTAPGLNWGLAEGRVGGPESYQTYILLANPGTEPARVQLQFLGDGVSEAPSSLTIDVPAQRRVNVPVTATADPEAAATNFGATITSDKPIVVERAMYWNVNGEVWAAGTNATATRLP